MGKSPIRSLLATALALAIVGSSCPALAAGGPRAEQVTGASCLEARAKAEKKANEVCAKAGGLAWTEYSAECDEDTQTLPGVPVTLDVHFLCGADL